MKRDRALGTFVLALVCAGLLGCGGGGGGGSDPETTLPPGGGGDGGTPPGEYVVVRYDHDGDGNPDLLTLDRTESPLVVVEALRGTDDGGSVDATKDLAGQTLDPSVSEALSAYLAESFDIASETELDAVDALGNRVTLTVFE
jgi:hypothetical protein